MLFDFHALFQYFLTFGEKSPAKNRTMTRGGESDVSIGRRSLETPAASRAANARRLGTMRPSVASRARLSGPRGTVSSHNFTSHNFKLRVSNPGSIADSVSKYPLSSNLPGAEPIFQIELLKNQPNLRASLHLREAGGVDAGHPGGRPAACSAGAVWRYGALLSRAGGALGEGGGSEGAVYFNVEQKKELAKYCGLLFQR